MADNQTKLTIELETILRGLDKTLRGLEQVRKSLESVASPKFNPQSTDRAAQATQRLATQQQRLAVQAQELANRQERARQATDRLALAQQRLSTAQERVAKSNLGPQLDSHVRAFRAAEAATNAFNQRLSSVGNALRSVGQGLASIGATLSVAVTAPLVAAGVASVDAAVRLDSLKRGLTAIVGSADEANRQLARLTQIAKLPGIGFEEAIQGSIRLQAVGFSASEAERSLRQFSNAIALTGGGRDELARVTVQLGQLAAKGKVLSQDLRPIIEAAPAVGRALLQAFGTVNADDIQELGLSSKEFLNILVGQLEQLPRAAAGAKNSFENFRDEIFRAAAAVGESFLPALVRLAEVVGPAITKLADIFARLPQPVQLVAVGAVALLAALGPVLFVVGQLTLGVGRLLTGFVELNAAGILPTIASLRALTAGTLGAAAAQRTLAASSALVAGGVGLLLTALAAVVTAYAVYNTFQKDAATLGKERADALTDEINRLRDQAKFLDSLSTGVKRTGDEQERLLEIYDQLNISAKTRVTGISDEEKRLAALREELQRLLQLREQERIQAAAQLAATAANSVLAVAAEDDQTEAIVAAVQARTKLIEELEKTGEITVEQRQQVAALAKQFGLLNFEADNTSIAIGLLREENRELVTQQGELRESGKEVRGGLKDQVALLRSLQQQTGLSARELLVAAKNMGVFRGDIDQTLVLLDRYIQLTDQAARATRDFRNAMSIADTDLRKAGENADALAKRRKEQISDAASAAREAARSFQDARKFLDEFIVASPGLRQAFEREAQIQGKSFDELVQKSLESAFGRGAQDRAGTSLRNAQEELAKALAQVALASSEEQVRIKKEENDRLLRANEVAQRLQLISYREFLETRANLSAASIDREIIQQADIVRAARTAQLRLIAASDVPGIPAAERTKRQAQAAKANEEAIKAESKLNDLAAKREQIQVDLQQELRLAQHQQIEDIRQLDIEFAELRGHIQDALDAQTVEKFRERLTDLGLAQARINKQLVDARKAREADRVAELEEAQRLNQSQIDVIELLVQQERATNQLSAAQELVRRAKERQAELESQLSFEVENRGLKEEDAIRLRLAGEQKLIASLELARDITRDTIADLQAKGVEPPQALVEFVRDIGQSLRGLGELSFSEQFRLAQREFDRINDERIAKIQDVERAVRNRDIAEVEGAIIIRSINGQYTADLEAQLVLLRQIADASNDRGLQQQAANAAETVKDTRDEVAGLSRQIESAGKDAFRSGLAQFLKDVARDADNAKEHILKFIDSILSAINDTIAENLSQQLFESLFGGPQDRTGGFIANVKRLLGFGGGAEGGVAASAGQAVEGAAQTTAATTAATALVTGGATAGTALATGGTTASATLITSITAAAASFSAAVVAAGAAFAAAVAAAAGTQAAGSLAGSGIGNFALGDILPARPGGRVVRVAEAGHAEAVLTTDPRHAAKQARLLSRFLRITKGLQGRFPVPLAEGAIVSPRQAELNALSGIVRPPQVNSTLPDSSLAVAGAPVLNVRNINQINRGELVRGYLRSAEGTQDILNVISENAPDIGRRIGVR